MGAKIACTAEIEGLRSIFVQGHPYCHIHIVVLIVPSPTVGFNDASDSLILSVCAVSDLVESGFVRH